MLIVDPLTGEMVPHSVCSFGLTEIIAPFVVEALVSAGIGAETAAAIAPAVIGAGGGALVGGGVGEITTGKPLTGALEGGLTGGAIGGLGPLVGSGLGIGAGAGDVLVGAGAGALGSAIAGQDPLVGAGGGALSGGIVGLTSGGFGGTGGAAAPSSGVTGSSAGVSAAGTAAPSSATSSVSLGLDQSAAPGASFTTGGSGGGGDALSLISPPPAPPGMGGAVDPVSGGVIGVPPNASTGAFSPSTGQPSSLFGSIFGGSEGTSGGNTAGSLGGIFGSGGGGGDSGGGGIGSFLKSYGAPLVAAGGIGMDLMKGHTPLPGESALTQQAADLAAQGKQLGSYLQTGNLPPGVHQSLNAASESAKAAIRSKYAQMGGNTSAMQQDLAHVDQVAATQGVQIATQLLQQGVSETGLSEQIYSQLLNLSLQQNAGLSSAIGKFATSLVPGSSSGRPMIFQQQPDA